MVNIYNIVMFIVFFHHYYQLFIQYSIPVCHPMSSINRRFKTVTVFFSCQGNNKVNHYNQKPKLLNVRI